MEKFILYNYFRSSTSYRVRIAMHLKEIPFEYRAIHLLKQEQHSPEFLKVNPQGEVPALKHGNLVISQSLPLLEYLDEIHPAPAIYPKHPGDRAQVRQFCENINSYMHPVCNLKILQYLEANHGYDLKAKEAWISHWQTPGFTALERLLERHAGKFCYGDDVTAADICLIPMMFSARRFHVDLSPFPILNRIDRECQKIEAFKKAHPLRQVDTPEDLRIP
ncbi:MAG TPA: maleylacetoacetate isomerase [Pseudobdellovibrionaceae bacterium]|nr:maleylacetoacetate isomerase [Pseudobdellovibrionaceae bacterium]